MSDGQNILPVISRTKSLAIDGDSDFSNPFFQKESQSQEGWSILMLTGIWEKDLINFWIVVHDSNFQQHEFSVDFLIMNLESHCTKSLQILICEARTNHLIRASYSDSLLEQWHSRASTLGDVGTIKSIQYNYWTEQITSQGRFSWKCPHSPKGNSAKRPSKAWLKSPCQTHSTKEAIEQHVPPWMVEIINTWEDWTSWPN